MDKKVFKTLEFDKILKLLAEHTDNPEVKEKILSLSPADSFSAAEKLLSDTTEGVGIILRRGNPQSLKITNVTGAVRRAEMGGVMTMRELIALRDLSVISSATKKYVQEDKSLSEGTITSLSGGLETLSDIQKKAADADKNGEIRAADARLILRASVGLEELK